MCPVSIRLLFKVLFAWKLGWVHLIRESYEQKYEYNITIVYKHNDNDLNDTRLTLHIIVIAGKQPQPQVVRADQKPKPKVVHQPMPPSRYNELLRVIEELGKDVKPTYAGSKNAGERLRKGELASTALNCKKTVTI